jgi:hypothetical protein
MKQSRATGQAHVCLPSLITEHSIAFMVHSFCASGEEGNVLSSHPLHSMAMARLVVCPVHPDHDHECLVFFSVELCKEQ